MAQRTDVAPGVEQRGCAAAEDGIRMDATVELVVQLCTCVSKVSGEQYHYQLFICKYIMAKYFS